MLADLNTSNDAVTVLVIAVLILAAIALLIYIVRH